MLKQAIFRSFNIRIGRFLDHNGHRLQTINALSRPFSDSTGSVTYSGGQASQGQGGFYGSGGARTKGASAPTHHPEALARKADVDSLRKIMEEIETLEQELRSLGGVVNSRTIEIKSRIKKTISNPRVREMLERLSLKGEPVWGLSAKERDLVRAAKIYYSSS